MPAHAIFGLGRASLKINASFPRPRRPPTPGIASEAPKSCVTVFPEGRASPPLLSFDKNEKPAPFGIIPFEEFDTAIRAAERFDPMATYSDTYFNNFGNAATYMIDRHIPYIHQTWRNRLKPQYVTDVEEMVPRGTRIKDFPLPLDEEDMKFLKETVELIGPVMSRLDEIKNWLTYELWENEAIVLTINAYITRLEEYQLACSTNRHPLAPTVVVQRHQLLRQREQLISADEWLQRQMEGFSQDARLMNEFSQSLEDLIHGRSTRFLFRF